MIDDPHFDLQVERVPARLKQGPVLKISRADLFKPFKDKSDDRELREDIPINNEIPFYPPLQSVSRRPATSDTETVNVSTSDSKYVRAIEDIMRGEMTPAKYIKSQSDRHINLGFILINLANNTTELSEKFTRKVSKGRISFILILTYLLLR